MTYPNTTYPNTPLHVDIPVKLAEVKAVFSVAALSFEGDLPGTCLRRLSTFRSSRATSRTGARHLRLSWSSTATQATSR
jgi:hypothetical protein